MRKALIVTICALFGVGCFFGGESDTSTTPEKKDSIAVLPKTPSVSPGLYAGDYAWIDSNKAEWESEFYLNSDGTFRLIGISANDALYDMRGKWAQHDSGLFFVKMNESWSRDGVFYDFTEVEDDTNSIRQVTDTSFIRREWTPLRQKPYWITYTKRSFPKVKEGEYSFVQNYPNPTPEDSLATIDVKFNIKLKGGDFLFSVVEDTLESFQASAEWAQVGSFLSTEKNLQRYAEDSTHAFPSAWDTVGGIILKRLRTVSDTSFHMWNSPTAFNPGSWDPYHRAH